MSGLLCEQAEISENGRILKLDRLFQTCPSQVFLTCFEGSEFPVSKLAYTQVISLLSKTNILFNLWYFQVLNKVVLLTSCNSLFLPCRCTNALKRRRDIIVNFKTRVLVKIFFKSSISGILTVSGQGRLIHFELLNCVCWLSFDFLFLGEFRPNPTIHRCI